MKFLDLEYGGEKIIAMGDMIDCVPLINWLIKKHGRLIIPVQKKYRNNIMTFFPVHVNADFVGLNSFADYDYFHNTRDSVTIKITRKDKPRDYKHFEIATLYEAAGWDYDERFELDTITEQVKRIPQREVPAMPYAFIPEGGSEGSYRIDRRYVSSLLPIVPAQNEIMLTYATMIQRAAEIHCHITAFQRLIDKLPTNGKLFLHHYVRQGNVKPENFYKYKMLTKEWKQLI